MSLVTITISSVDYTSYASVAEADDYLAVDPVRGATWAALTTDQKGSNLVAATRRLDLLKWQGEKAVSTQDNAWYRTGVTDADGNVIGDTELPQEVEDATILLAGSIAIDSTVAQTTTSGSNTKRVKAGSAEVEYFRPTTGVALKDETAWDMLRCAGLLASSSTATTSSAGAYASGTDQTTYFPDSYDVSRGYD